MVEHRICNPKVMGSSPLASSSPSNFTTGLKSTQKLNQETLVPGGCPGGRKGVKIGRPREDGGELHRQVRASFAGGNRSRFEGYRVRAEPLCAADGVFLCGRGGAFERPLRARTGGASTDTSSTPFSVPRVRFTERYRSGQTGQTVNLLSIDFGGSNPPLSTTENLSAEKSIRGFEQEATVRGEQDAYSGRRESGGNSSVG